MEEPMRIAIIGGGKRCRAFLEMVDAKRFPHLKAQIVAVADPDDQAAGMQLAREKAIFTTGDYRDFYEIPDLDLVIELTGKEELLKDLKLTKNRGYSINDEEYIQGLICIGAPLINFNTKTVAGAVSLDFPASELSLSAIERNYTGILTKLASELSGIITTADM